MKEQLMIIFGNIELISFVYLTSSEAVLIIIHYHNICKLELMI